MRFHLRLLTPLLTVWALAAPAAAQIDQGRLTGTVKDAQGGVLPGVTVTAKSPALIGTRSVVTESEGTYSMASLPSGEYELTFELAGFQSFKRGNIQLNLGQILTIDAALQVAALQESVTVSGASPVVDMQNTSVGTDFKADKLVGVPTATDIWSVLGQAAGVRMTGFDVGGSHKSQQTGYESFGIRNQNRVLNDGVDTTEGTGGAGFYADFFANEEVAVSAAGGDVEMNAPGSAVVNTIKSGGNTFKMLNNLTYQQESWVADNIDASTSARGFTGQPNIKFWEGHTDVGGPIMRDKLWFFGSYNHFKIDKVISGVPRTIATDLGLFDNEITKETWKVSQKDTIVGYFQWGRKQKPNRGLSASVSPEAAQPQDSVSWVVKGEHQRVWSNRLFTDVKVNLFGYDFPLGVKVDPATQPPRFDVGASFTTGAAWDAFDLARQKPAVTAQATYFVPNKQGSHDLKFGFEYLLDISKYTIDGRSGPIQYRDLNGKTDQIQFVDVGKNSDLGSTWSGGNNRDQRYAGYAQDRWKPQQPDDDHRRPPLGLPAAVLSGRETRSDHQGHPAGVRRPGVPHRPADVPGPIVPARRHHHAELVGAAPRRELRRQREGEYGPQRILRAVLLQLRRRLQLPQPGRSELQDVQVQRSEWQPSLRRSAGARRLRRLGGWHDHQGRSEHEEALR
jgi:hypothetical protein